MDSTGDALSDVLRMVHLKACIYFVKEMPTAWGMDIPASANGPLHMVLEGRCLLRCKGKDISLNAGDAVLLPHGARHQMLNEPDAIAEPAAQVMQRLVNEKSTTQSNFATRMLCGHFERDTTVDHPFFKDLPETIVVRKIFDQPDSDRLTAIVNLIAAESNDERPGGCAITDRMGEVLFVSLLRNWMIESKPATGILATMNDPRLSRTLRHIHQYPGHELDLDKLASVAGMSRTAFATRFRDVLGTPPATYLAEWRMLTAKQLLQQTELPIADIVERIGYASDASFARAFKRKFGETPGTIRRVANTQ